MNTYIEKAVSIAGSKSGLARACGVSPPAVYKWLRFGVSAERALSIERATQGAVTRYELRPDIFGREPESRS